MVDQFDSLHLLQTTFNEVVKAVDEATTGLSDIERERAMFYVVSAYSLSQEMWLFKSDPGEPAFTEWMADGRKTAGDSPYTVYLTTPVSVQHSYRLYGKLGQPTYFALQIYKQIQGFNMAIVCF